MTSSATDDDDAASWAIRLDNGPLTTNEQRLLDGWLRADGRRQGALLRAEATLAYLGRGQALATPVLPSNDVAGRADAVSPSRRRFVFAGACFAGMAAAGIGALFLATPAPIEIKTALGEIRRVPLPDGSVASVNTASDVSIVLADRQRHVRLARGEAWFQVAHDRTRPFVVEAGDVRVRAVGTAFSVRRLKDGADILVTEGTVEAWVVGHERRGVRIAAGSRSFVDDDGGPIEVASASDTIGRALSWRTGELALNGESLDHAVAELNRYNARKIVIDTPELGREPLVGYFRVDQPDDFGRAIGATLGATVSAQADIIHLSR